MKKFMCLDKMSLLWFIKQKQWKKLWMKMYILKHQKLEGNNEMTVPDCGCPLW